MKTMSKLMLAVMLLWTTGLSAQQTSGETSQRRIKEEGKTIFDPQVAGKQRVHGLLPTQPTSTTTCKEM